MLNLVDLAEIGQPRACPQAPADVDHLLDLQRRAPSIRPAPHRPPHPGDDLKAANVQACAFVRIGVLMRILRVLTCLLITFAMLPPMPTAAGVRRWTSQGPFGGIVMTIAEHPTKSGVLLSGSRGGGLFRSTDGGRTWRRRRDVPADAWVEAVAFAPSAGAVAFAVTITGFVFKSTDAGRTWEALGESGADEATSVAVHPRRPRIVFLGGESATYRSTDGGKTWSEVLNYSHDSQFRPGRTIAIAPTKPDVVYSAGLNGLRISRDGGDTWKPGGTPSGWEVVVHPRKASVVYVGGAEGVAKSVDGGRTFRPVAKLAEYQHVGSLTLDRNNPSTLYAATFQRRLFRLTRGGAEAKRWDHGRPREGAGAIAALRDGTVLAGAGSHGIYRREPGATRWKPSRRGFRNSTVFSVAVAPSNQSIVYAGAGQQGIARSTDNGRTWHWRGLRGRSVYAVTVHPARADVAYAATNLGVFRTGSGGRRWRRVFDRQGTIEVVVSRSTPAVVYTGGSVGLFRSTDGGSTWTQTALEPDSEIYSVAVHPAQPNTVYAGTVNQGVVKSTDGGKTWKTGAGTLLGEYPEDIAIDPTRPQRVFVSMSGVGILRSVDGGATWEHMTGGTPPSGGNAIVVDPRRPRRVYAAVGEGWNDSDHVPGVFRSIDGGRTWQHLNNKGLSSRNITSLALGDGGRVLHAGTGNIFYVRGGGVFQYHYER